MWYAADEFESIHRTRKKNSAIDCMVNVARTSRIKQKSKNKNKKKSQNDDRKRNKTDQKTDLWMWISSV